MTQDGQFELTDFLGKKIESKSVMDLTAWINSQGKAQYAQIGEVIEDVTIERTPKDEDSLKALELLGKYHKLFTDKQEVEVQGTVVFANEDDIAD